MYSREVKGERFANFANILEFRRAKLGHSEYLGYRYISHPVANLRANLEGVGAVKSYPSFTSVFAPTPPLLFPYFPARKEEMR